MDGYWVLDTEGDDLLDGITKFHCIVFKRYKKDEWVILLDPNHPEYKEALLFIESSDIKARVLPLDHLDDFLSWSDVKSVACHNLHGYDVPAFKKLKLVEDFDMCPQSINGHEIKMIDTLSVSRALWPDRPLPRGCPTHVFNPVTGKKDMVGPHGLMAWGYRVANMKPTVHDWRDQPLVTYLDRCIEDVKINDLTLTALFNEAGKAAKGGSWSEALKLNNKCDWLMEKQFRDGILFDQEFAVELRDRIDRMMEDIEKEIEPRLPPREMPKSQRPNFPANPFKGDGSISADGWKWLKRLGYEVDDEALNFKPPPKTAFKNNGELSANGRKYCINNGVVDEAKMPDFIRGCLKKGVEFKPLPDDEMEKARKDLQNKVEPSWLVPMKIANQKDIKEYLVEHEGWRPTIWGTKDATRDAFKKEYPKEVQVQKLRDYIQEVRNSVYMDQISDEMDINFCDDIEDRILDKLKRQARYLVTTPKFKDEKGDLCPSIEMLDGELAKAIVKWLSLRNRRSVIQTKDEKKDTGWLNNPRLAVDGRIGQGFGGVTNTNRYKHREIVNLPKADPSVLLGHEMRSCFIAPKGYTILGYDGSNLEQFVAASYAFRYDNGDYARKLGWGLAEGEEPIDAHTENAKAYSRAAGREVTRSSGKNITYAVLYGAQAKKIAKMLGISRRNAQKVIDAFWDSNMGLKKLRDNLEAYWTSTDKRYIRGIDGRKIYTRSKHSLVNALFQSCGSLIMMLSGCFMYDMLARRGLLKNGKVTRLAFVHRDHCGHWERSQLNKSGEFRETLALS